MSAQLLKPAELAHRWGVSVRTLEAHRAKRFGPPWIKVGKCVRYDLTDVIAHEALMKSASVAPKKRGKR